MPKMVIEVPEEFTEVGKAMAEHLAALQRTVSRLGGGKAVDYAEIEQAMAVSAGRTELAGHRAILQSLDIDVAAVMIGGMRYTRVGRARRHTTRWWVRSPWRDRCTVNRASVGGSRAAFRTSAAG